MKTCLSFYSIDSYVNKKSNKHIAQNLRQNIFCLFSLLLRKICRDDDEDLPPGIEPPRLPFSRLPLLRLL